MESNRSLDIATFALLNGVAKASQAFSLPPTDVTHLVAELDFDGMKLLARLKELVLEFGLRRGTRGAARQFGISEKYMTELVKEYLTTTANSPENTIYPHNTYERFAQTFSCAPEHSKFTSVAVQYPAKHTQEVEEEPEDHPATKYAKDAEAKRSSKQYTTAEKIKAVREFSKHSNQSKASQELSIPTVSLNRWKDKMKMSLFQEAHVENLYGPGNKVHKDKFFQDLDEALFNWFTKNQATIADPDQAIVSKARSVARIDDNEPRISESWLAAFKAHYLHSAAKPT